MTIRPGPARPDQAKVAVARPSLSYTYYSFAQNTCHGRTIRLIRTERQRRKKKFQSVETCSAADAADNVDEPLAPGFDNDDLGVEDLG